MTISKLKNIALVFMILDHIGFFFQDSKYYLLLRSIGRLAAPIFFFCFVEGYFNTHDKNKYKLRLLISSISMFILNFFMIFLFKVMRQPLSNAISLFVPNMFFTFFRWN